MLDRTRRQALLAAASGITALAGCATEDDLPTIDYRRRPLEDYEVRQMRNEDGAGLFTTGDGLPTKTDDEQGRSALATNSVIVSEDKIADHTFGDVPEAKQLQTFITETDFDSSSLYIFAMPVQACYEVHVQSVTVEWDKLNTGDLHPHADFCQTYRPADVECEADEIHSLGIAIRLPISAEQSTGSGYGNSSSCQEPVRGEYFNRTVTPVSGGEDE